MSTLPSLAARESWRPWAFVITVAGLAVAVNPFGVPAFSLPRLTWLKAGSAILAVMLVSEVCGRRRRVRSSAWLPLGLLVASAVLSTVLSVAPIRSLTGDYLRWEGLWTLACYWILFVAALRWGRDRKLFTLLVPALMAGAVLVAVLSLLEFLGVYQLGGGLDLFCAAGFGAAKATSSRIVGTCGNAAFLGGYFAVVVPLAVAVALEPAPPRRWWRALAVAAAGFGGVALVLTYARAAWLGGLAAVVVAVVLMRPTGRSLLAAGIGVLVVVTLSASAASVWGGWGLGERLSSAFDWSSGSLPQRAAIMRDTLPMVRDHRLVGVGLDAYGAVFPRYASVDLLRTATSASLSNDRAHNDLLQIAATQGIVGLAAWLMFLWAYAAAASRGLRRMSAGWPKAVLVGAAAGTLGYVIQAQLEFSTFVVAPFFWALAGLVWSSASRFEEAPAPIAPGGEVRAKAAVMVAAALAAATMTAAASLWIADAASNRGIAGLYAGDLAQALEGYRAAVRANPLEPLYHASLGSALVSATTRYPHRAATLLEEAAERFATARRIGGPDSTPYFLAGNAYLEFGARRGRTELARESIAAYERGLRFSPRSVEALSQLGRAYAFSNRWSEALATWERALAVRPDDPVSIAYTGRALAQLGDDASARDRYERALAIDPDNEVAKEGLASLEASRPTEGGEPGR